MLKRLNEQLHLLEFPELFKTNCVLVVLERAIFVVDTFTGPDAMSEILSFIRRKRGRRDLFIVNTHSHFDHIWGNCAFGNAPVVAHEKCIEIMRKESKQILEATVASHPEWLRGRVGLVYPSIVLEKTLSFHQENRSVIFRHKEINLQSFFVSQVMKTEAAPAAIAPVLNCPQELHGDNVLKTRGTILL